MKLHHTILAALALVGLSSACCDAEGDGSSNECADGTRATPCCGFGPCNVFCCNCDGGCRVGPCKGDTRARAELQLPIVATPSMRGNCTDSLFERVKGDRNEGLGLTRYLAWVATEFPAALVDASLMDAWKAHFKSFDANGDGIIALNEMHRPA